MNLSYWEQKSWFSNVDHTIVGSGIVGLSTALHLKKRFPKAKILILECGLLPQGASTKNAGFACFGSISELIDDLNSHSAQEMVTLVQKRWEGLQLLRKTLGDSTIEYQQLGGYELFGHRDKELLENCLNKKNEINGLLKPIFEEDVFEIRTNAFGFKRIQPDLFFNKFEGQIDTGKMMVALLKKAIVNGIMILNNCTVEAYSENFEDVDVKTDTLQFKTKKLLIATNGFASQMNIKETQPARAQVLITKPIEGLSIKGTFHLDKGYYYFRNIDNRILLGGGRNLDFKGEQTSKMAQTPLIQNRLEELLKTTILPNTHFEIDHRWSGIMGVGNLKKPIVKQVSNNVYCGVRLGGMGVAIGSIIGEELSRLVDN
ncbi:NAD(P)/FAD-dependent oxidoreductase [Sungkyunkwania multivorans]|uniref:NAD(P)/FAD-dependent oxidoreductase n=1 Tax=Sungkyunkwania multivorans TaxID=1173618 RepID=A0ABW3D182_9FLAO